MKLHCPTCNRPVDIGNASRYEVFTCACGRKFRGIHAEECLLDYLFWKYAGVPVRLLTFGQFGRLDQNKLTITSCPFCDSEIGISYNSKYLGVTGPSHCWACTNKLPTDPVNNLIERDGQKSVPKGALPTTASTPPLPSRSLPPPSPPGEQSLTELLKAGRHKIARGEYDRAVELFTEAIRLAPASVEAYFGRACAHYDKGYLRREFAAAIPDLVMTLRFDPSHQEAKERLDEAKKNLP